MTRRVLTALLFVLPVMILVPHFNDFPYQPLSEYSDLAVTHYPNTYYLQQFLQQWQALPLWSPLILSGYPFSANPLSGLFYVPGWLALLFPLPMGLNLVIALHLIWGGVGMYRLMRAFGLHENAALAGGLLFEAMPKLFAHIGTGHQSLVYAVTWTPWLLLAEQVAGRNGQLRLVLPGIFLGMLALADVRWLMYAGLFWLAFRLHKATSHRVVKDRLHLIEKSPWKDALKDWVVTTVTNSLVAFLVAAPLVLPLLQYTRFSTRSEMSMTDAFQLSLPPVQLLGLAVPNIGGSAEWIVYPGAVSFFLGILALFNTRVRKASLFWILAAALSLIYSLGSYIPFLDRVAFLPGFDLLRVPPRAMFLVGICLAVIAANAVDGLFYQGDTKRYQMSGWFRLAVFGYASFFALMAIGVWLAAVDPLPRFQFTWAAAFSSSMAAILLLWNGNRISTRAAYVALMFFALVDLIGVNALSLAFRSSEQVLNEGKSAAEYVLRQSDGESFSVYSPSYSISQQVSAKYGIQLADGVDPLQLKQYAQFMEGATGVPYERYSVTIPPFRAGDPATDNQNAIPDAKLLGLLNVHFVIAEYDLPASELRLIERIEKKRIYANPFALPRAWVQLPSASVGEKITSRPVVSYLGDRINLTAQGPGLLVLSEVAYPGWHVTVDGKKKTVEVVGGLLRGVLLENGNHQVSFTYSPWPVSVGLGLSLVAWLGMIGIFWSERTAIFYNSPRSIS